ncbi:hypothetical protein DQT04_21765 [Salmonella enterica subsp. enterica serovar Muenchen]|nr:hypothetical protein [Salmonella enterica subsp. enterica serovar Muenchen]
MKKTLIALAVAASAVVSGSAMAWTVNGTGGNLELGGTLTPQKTPNPWEVQVGAAVTNLDAPILKGQTVVDIVLAKPIPVLGIRTLTNQPFLGGTGLSPQISYGNAIDLAAFSNSEAPLTLDVKNPAGTEKIGVLTTSLLAGAEVSFVDSKGTGNNAVFFGRQAGDAFYGGLPSDRSMVLGNPFSRIAAISSEFVAKYNDQGTQKIPAGVMSLNFRDSAYKYSAYYGSGIEAGKTIKITLAKAASGDVSIPWKAIMPITVSYV